MLLGYFVLQYTDRIFVLIFFFSSYHSTLAPNLFPFEGSTPGVKRTSSLKTVSGNVNFVLLCCLSIRATITLYSIGRPVRATITLYPIGRPVRATITLYPIGRPTLYLELLLHCIL